MKNETKSRSAKLYIANGELRFKYENGGKYEK